MTDAFRLIAALTQQPDTVDAVLGEGDWSERDRVAATLVKLVASRLPPTPDGPASAGRVLPLDRDKHSR